MTTIYDVPADSLIERLSSYLKKNIEAVTPPEWASYVKTACYRENPPQNRDWWYTRSASILRKLYIKGPIGVSRLRKEYGGRKRRGRIREHTWLGGGKNIRLILQQLENAGFIEKDAGEGRRLSSEGQRLLNKLASEIVKKA